MKRFFIFLLCLILHRECQGLRVASYVCAVISDTLSLVQVTHEISGVCKEHVMSRRGNEEVEPLCCCGCDEVVWNNRLNGVYDLFARAWCFNYQENGCGLIFKLTTALSQPICSVCATVTSPFLADQVSYVYSICWATLGISLSAGYLIGCTPWFKSITWFRRRVINDE